MGKTIVIKIGTSSLINETNFGGPNSSKTSLNIRQLSSIVETCSTLRNQGHNVVLVSSGAIGTGRHVLNFDRKPKTLAERQALAAIGQVHLIAKYESLFSAMRCYCAQVLITYDTFRWREHYSNAENTFLELFKLGIIPVVNENDTVATEEIRSENDTMAAMVASLVNADLLYLLTDVPGLYTSNPKNNPNAKLINFVQDIHELDSMFETDEDTVGSVWGTGGMSVKINAASLAASLGIDCTIMSGKQCEKIIDLIPSEGNEPDYSVGTTFAKVQQPPSKRKRWIRGLRCNGAIVLDDGAVEAAKDRRNIFPVGVTRVKGKFPHMAAVKLLDKAGHEIGTGLSNYSSEDLIEMKGMSAPQTVESETQIIHAVIYRKNLAVDLPRADNEEKTKVRGTSKDKFVTQFED